MTVQGKGVLLQHHGEIMATVLLLFYFLSFLEMLPRLLKFQSENRKILVLSSKLSIRDLLPSCPIIYDVGSGGQGYFNGTMP